MPWLIRHLPELGTLEPDERRAVLRGVPWWTYPVMAARAAIVAVVPSAIVGSIANAIVARGSPLVVPIAVCGTLVAATLLFYRMQLIMFRRTLQRQVIAAYRGRQLPMCLRCGYDLRGTSTDACPECGAGVQVKPVEDALP